MTTTDSDFIEADDSAACEDYQRCHGRLFDLLTTDEQRRRLGDLDESVERRIVDRLDTSRRTLDAIRSLTDLVG